MPVLTSEKAVFSDYFNSDFAISDLLKATSSCVLVPPRFEEIADEVIPEELPEQSIGFFSSGTSGLPKVHLLSREKLHLNAALSVPVFGLSSADRVLILASPWHIAGFTWFAAAEQAGATVKISAPYLDKLDTFSARIAEFNPTVLFAVPSVLHALLDRNMPFVPHIAVGGAPVPVEDFPKLKTRCDRFTQAYGQSEAGGLLSAASMSTEKLDASFFRCVGVPGNGISLFCDGIPGEAKPILALSPSAVDSAVYVTGDIGWKDAEGNLCGMGRKENAGNCNSLTGISMVLHK